MPSTDPQADLPPPGELLFVYGTLQRGGQFHHLMRAGGTDYLGPARLVSAYPLLLAEYPCLLDQPGRGHRVRGELYRLPRRQAWLAIDRLENHPHEYRRRPEPVECEGQRFKAWTYFYLRDHPAFRHLKPVEAFPVDARG
jgi:gamma-glutamylaminecyclotransferase